MTARYNFAPRSHLNSCTYAKNHGLSCCRCTQMPRASLLLKYLTCGESLCGGLMYPLPLVAPQSITRKLCGGRVAGPRIFCLKLLCRQELLHEDSLIRWLLLLCISDCVGLLCLLYLLCRLDVGQPRCGCLLGLFNRPTIRGVLSILSCNFMMHCLQGLLWGHSLLWHCCCRSTPLPFARQLCLTWSC